jgi:putative transposase
MPRQARSDIPGALHHIMMRGINKAIIFDDNEDKARFLERLGQNVVDGTRVVIRRNGALSESGGVEYIAPA